MLTNLCRLLCAAFSYQWVLFCDLCWGWQGCWRCVCVLTYVSCLVNKMWRWMIQNVLNVFPWQYSCDLWGSWQYMSQTVELSWATFLQKGSVMKQLASQRRFWGLVWVTRRLYCFRGSFRAAKPEVKETHTSWQLLSPRFLPLVWTSADCQDLWL